MIPAIGKASDTASPTRTAPCQSGMSRGMGGAARRDAPEGRRFHHNTIELIARNMMARQNTVFASTLHNPIVPMCNAIPTAIALPNSE